ncbi:MAG: hypothetical protein Q3976_04345 [Corynebacterium sp.]|nr:hypothetical protein [Corynebacterium sp.]
MQARHKTHQSGVARDSGVLHWIYLKYYVRSHRIIPVFCFAMITAALLSLLGQTPLSIPQFFVSGMIPAVFATLLVLIYPVLLAAIFYTPAVRIEVVKTVNVPQIRLWDVFAVMAVLLGPLVYLLIEPEYSRNAVAALLLMMVLSLYIPLVASLGVLVAWVLVQNSVLGFSELWVWKIMTFIPRDAPALVDAGITLFGVVVIVALLPFWKRRIHRYT